MNTIINKSPKVMILITTCNDVTESAISSAVKQTYENKIIVIGDDSKNENKKAEVDLYAKKYGALVIRRQGNKGYKAGNENNAIREVLRLFPDTEFIMVQDADSEFIDNNTLATLVTMLQSNPETGYIQCSHITSGDGTVLSFSEDIKDTYAFSWNTQITANKFSHQASWGHGVIFRVQLWNNVHGIPEDCVSEDIAFSTMSALEKTDGRFESEIRCIECAPPTFEAFRKQQSRYTKGILQFYKKFPGYFLNKNISTVARLGFLLYYSCNLLPVLSFLLMLDFVFIFPVLFGEKCELYFTAYGHLMHIGCIYIFPEYFRKIFDLPFFIFTCLMLFSQSSVMWTEVFKNPVKAIRSIIISTTVYGAKMLICTLSSIDYFIFREAKFEPTNEKVGGNLQANDGEINDEGKRKRVKFKSLLKQVLDATSEKVYWIEVFLGLGIIVTCIFTMNLFYISHGLILLLSLLIHKFRWENKAAKTLVYFPFFIMVIMLGSLFFGIV